VSKASPILEEIRKMGMLTPFWTGLASAPNVLEVYWRSFVSLLNSGTIPKDTKMMICYECALADGCPGCKSINRQLLVELGMRDEVILKLEKDIKGSNLDDQTKNILVYSFHIARDPHGVDENFHSTFKTLIGQERLVEIAAWVNNASSIMNMTHSLQLHG